MVFQVSGMIICMLILQKVITGEARYSFNRVTLRAYRIKKIRVARLKREAKVATAQLNGFNIVDMEDYR